jgi:hypothetical protein
MLRLAIIALAIAIDIWAIYHLPRLCKDDRLIPTRHEIIVDRDVKLA